MVSWRLSGAGGRGVGGGAPEVVSVPPWPGAGPGHGLGADGVMALGLGRILLGDRLVPSGRVVTAWWCCAG
jgi:hypothetical protein